MNDNSALLDMPGEEKQHGNRGRKQIESGGVLTDLICSSYRLRSSSLPLFFLPACTRVAGCRTCDGLNSVSGVICTRSLDLIWSLV